MDKRLLDTCRYTGIKATPTPAGDSSMALCPFCGGVTKITRGEEQILALNDNRCSYCGTNIFSGLNFAQLETAISDAQLLHDTAVEGTDPGEYAVGSKVTLQTAINTASALYTTYNPVPTQAIINTAVTTLGTAVTTFNTGKVA
jgi:hypothetical protein